MKFFDVPSTKKKLSVLFAGQWSSGMIHTEGLRVRQVPGFNSRLSPFLINFNAMFQQMS